MNFIYLSPHFPPNYYNFCIALKELGVNVLGVADTPYDELRPELKYALTEYYRVNNMENYDSVLRALAYFTYKYGKIDRLDSHNEYWLETEARLRSDFNIYGTNLDSIEDIKYKSRMKQKFIKAGLNTAKGKVINDIKTAEKFAKEVGFPIFAKPDKGVGATGTFKIKNKSEIEDFFRKKDDVEYIFEEFIEGEIHTFDGLVDRDGNLVFYTSHFYESVSESIADGASVYVFSVREIPEDLLQAGLKIIKEFKVKEKFFHFEFFRTPEKKLIALEVNMRPPGGYMVDMFNYAADIDIYKEWANVIAYGESSLKYSRKYFCSFTSKRTNLIHYKHSNGEVLSKYHSEIIMSCKMPPVFSGAMGDYGFIARHESFDKIKEISNYITEPA
jgi:Biotin carboxylase